MGDYLLGNERPHLGGSEQLPPANRLTRLEALSLFAQGSAWFSREEDIKGTLAPGYLADFVIYDRDPLTVPDIELLRTEAVLTVVNGRIVFAQGTFAALNPPLPAPLRPGRRSPHSAGTERRGRCAEHQFQDTHDRLVSASILALHSRSWKYVIPQENENP